MTIIKVLGDGSTIPRLTESMPVIVIDRGEVQYGRYLESDFCAGGEYVRLPLNAPELRDKVWQYAFQECAEMLQKKHPVHVLCPTHLAKLMKF